MNRRTPCPAVPARAPRPLAALLSLCSLGLHTEVFVPAFLEALHAWVPSSRNLFDRTDEHGRLVRYFIEGPIDAQIAQLYFDEFHNRREAEAMPAFDSLRRSPAGVRSAEELDHPAFFRSDLYNQIWRPQGLHTRLEAVLRAPDGRLLGSLVLYRGPDDSRYTKQDEQRLAVVLPALAAALDAGGPVVVDDHHVPSPEPPETLLLTLDGNLCHASAGAHRLLLMAEGGATRDALSRPMTMLGGRLLPMVLLRLRERLAPVRSPHGWPGGAGVIDASGLHAGPAPSTVSSVSGLPGMYGAPRTSGMPLAPVPSIVHENPAGRFVARGELLHPVAPGAAPLAQVTLRRLEPHRVALERALRALPLTPGQIAVCRGLYAGLTQADIGLRLGVAPTTVTDHVRKAYRTLDVGSAAELRALVDHRIAAA